MTIVRLNRSRYSPKDLGVPGGAGSHPRRGSDTNRLRLLAFLKFLPAEIQSQIQQTETETATPVQAVPSVIISREMNYLINPGHPQFGQLVWGEPQPSRFDPRLIAAVE